MIPHAVVTVHPVFETIGHFFEIWIEARVFRQ
jgi:hypothetical protein